MNQLIVIFVTWLVVIEGYVTNDRVVNDQHYRIWGGSEAQLGQYKFVVSLQMIPKELATYRRFCGGSIVARRWILTAAHCLSPKTDNMIIYVRAGVIKSQCDEALTDGQFIPVLRRIIHPNYVDIKNVGHQNDIALLELAYPLEFNDNVQPVRLAKPDENFGNISKVLGWGMESKEQLDIPHIANVECANLKFAVTQEVDIQACKETLNEVLQDTYDLLVASIGSANNFMESGERTLINLLAALKDKRPGSFVANETTQASVTPVQQNDLKVPRPAVTKLDSKLQICVETESHPCKGDSGGPLIQTTATGEEVQIGITSLGHATCEDRYWVFTRVSYYVDWIESVTNV